MPYNHNFSYALADLIEEGIFPSDSLVGWYNYDTMEYLGNEMSVTILETDELGVTYLEDMLPLFELHECSYTQEVEADQYLKEAKLCPEKSIYYHSCACGAKGNTTFEAEDVVHNYVNNVCTGCGDRIIAYGLYDAEDNLIASWDELVNTYNMDVSTNHTYATHIQSANSPYYVLKNTPALANGVKLVVGDVSSLGTYAFGDCDMLTTIILPETLQSISDDAFAYCEALANIKIPNSITSIGKSAFLSCASLKSITLPESVSSIGSLAFTTAISSVYYEGTLEQWLQISFNSNSANPCHGGAALYIQSEIVDNLVIPSTITSIPAYAFYGCSSIISLELSDAVTTIGNYAFSSCTSLKTVKWPSNLSEINQGAFSGCESLERVVLPASVTSIGECAFGWCDSLRNVTFEEDSQLTSIGDASFSKCQVLETVTFGNNSKLTTIGEYAFFDCVALTSIQIPAGVTTIGAEAFNFCNSLTSITLFSETVIPYTRAMFYRPPITSIYVPSEIVDAYKTADGWVSVAEKIKPIQESVGDK